MYEEIGDAINKAIIGIVILLIIFVPLGLWKLAEIIIWIFTHIKII